MPHVAALQGQMTPLFEQVFRGGHGAEPSWGVSPWMPPVDLDETPDAFVLTAERPGLTPDAIPLEVHDRTRPGRGERTPEAGLTAAHDPRRERADGRSPRVCALPTPVEAEKVQAGVKDGLLERPLPTPARATPRRSAGQREDRCRGVAPTKRPSTCWGLVRPSLRASRLPRPRWALRARCARRKGAVSRSRFTRWVCPDDGVPAES